MKIKIKNVTESAANDGLLWELHKYAGIKEGDVIQNAKYNSSNNSVSFSIGTVDCVAWLGETCEEVTGKHV